MMEAINSNTATADQKNGINLFRMASSQIAKELPDDTTIINVSYETSANQTQLIAKSSKLQDFIQIDNLVLE